MSVASVLERSGNVRDIREQLEAKSIPSLPKLGISSESLAEAGKFYVNNLELSLKYAGNVHYQDYIPQLTIIFKNDILENLNSDDLYKAFNERLSDRIGKLNGNEDLEDNINDLLITLYSFKSFFPEEFKIVKTAFDNSISKNVTELIKNTKNITYTIFNILHNQSQVFDPVIAHNNFNLIWPVMKPALSKSLENHKKRVRAKSVNYDLDDDIYKAVASIRLLSEENFQELNIDDSVLDFGRWYIESYFTDKSNTPYARFSLMWNLGVIAGDIVMGKDGPELISPKSIMKSGYNFPEIERF